MKVERIIRTDRPIEQVFGYLSDFTTTTEWDPGTVRTERESGDGGVGTVYRNVSKLMGRKTALTYTVTDLVPNERISLRGVNKTVVAQDTMTLRSVGSGTEVTYTAEFEFSGFVRYLAPLLKPALTKLGNDGKAGMTTALARL